MMEVKNISKSFKDKTVLENVNLTVETGERVLISGPSGRGKTTLLRILMGLETPDSGKLIGAPKKISAVFQEDRLPPEFTVLQCIRMTAPKKITGKVIAAHLSELGLGDAMNKPSKELSGGMRRRVSVCRAILSDFDTLYLDEPFTGLDSETRAQVISYVKKYTIGKTIVLVSHSPEDTEAFGARILKI